MLRRRFRPSALILCCLVAMGSLACNPTPRWNLVLVTLDTTRADHIGCYGDERARTPNIDALAETGIRFARAYSAAPITAPSHSTILTGTYPPLHGFRDNGLFVLDDRLDTLAEILGREGYSTAAAIGAFPLAARFGLDQGFDLYDDRLVSPSDHSAGQLGAAARMFFDERPAGWVLDSVEPWLRETAEEPFFLWAHFFDPHEPHLPPSPYDQLFADDLYRGEIAYADEVIGVLMERLRRRGVAERTLVVVTADHGEGRGEHNEGTHSLLLYDTTLHVPLIFSVPGVVEGKVVDEPVGTVDILPTILEMLGVEAPDRVQGLSRIPLIEGREMERIPLYAETLSPRLSQQWGELRSIRVGDDKYIFGPRPELYDLGRDPRELADLVTREGGKADRLQRRLARFLRESSASNPADPVFLDEETRQRLMALGYVHAGAEGVEIREELRSEGLAPQDRIGDVTAFSLARQLLLEGNALGAREVTARLLRNNPDNPTYLGVEIQAEILLGQLDEAGALAKQLARVASGDPRTGRALVGLARAYHERGDLERATILAEQARFHSPGAWGLHLLATLRERQGDPEGELEALEKALEIDPDFAPARNDVAVRLAQTGRRAEAEVAFLRLVQDQPYYPRARFNFGAFLSEEGRLEPARDQFERAVDLDPGYRQARQGLVLVNRALGRLDEVERHCRALAGRGQSAGLAGLCEGTSSGGSP